MLRTLAIQNPFVGKCFNGEMPELAEGARLEIVCTPKRCTEGSNPSLSAIFHFGF